jgi:beta-lactamase class A
LFPALCLLLSDKWKMTPIRHPFSIEACISLVLALAAHPAAIAREVHKSTGGEHSAELQGKLNALAQRALPGTFGISIVDLQNGATWSVNAHQDLPQGYPLMSVFKAPVAAAVLSRIDFRLLSMDQKVTLTRSDVDPGSAVPSIGDNFKGDRMTFTVGQLLTAAVSQSDNTAVDALIKLVGGPRAVTAFLRAHGITEMHVDEDEAGVARVFDHLAGADAPPAGETREGEDRRLRAGYKAFLADDRNRSTPEAAAVFLDKLWRNQLLSRASTQYLLNLMYAQTVPRRLRDGLPTDVRLADKTGSSSTVDGMTAAYNDIGLLTWPDGYTVVVAAFLTASQASKEERDALFADLARETVKALHHGGS